MKMQEPKNCKPPYKPIITDIEKLIICYAKYKSDWGKYGEIDIFQYIKRTTNEAFENGFTLKEYINLIIEDEVSL